MDPSNLTLTVIPQRLSPCVGDEPVRPPCSRVLEGRRRPAGQGTTCLLHRSAAHMATSLRAGRPEAHDRFDVRDPPDGTIGLATLR